MNTQPTAPVVVTEDDRKMATTISHMQLGASYSANPLVAQLLATYRAECEAKAVAEVHASISELNWKMSGHVDAGGGIVAVEKWWMADVSDKETHKQARWHAESQLGNITAELAHLRRILAGSNTNNDYLRQRLAEAQRDSARLNWLICRIRVQDQTLVFEPVPYLDYTLDARPAIDAAMKSTADAKAR